MNERLRPSIEFMRWIRVLPTLLIVLALTAGCDYGRMKEDEAIQTHETVLPEMPGRSIPREGGIEVLRQADSRDLRNPLPDTLQVVERGRERYGFYCRQCHGPKLDGRGTVGQSFAPLPTNLLDPKVQQRGDGEIFKRISLGIKRHPPLWYTVSEEDRWAIIRYLRRASSHHPG